MDIRKLRAGYLEGGFEETRDPVAKRNDEKTVEQLQALGFKLVPIKVPDWTIDVSAIGVESAVFFDELVRSGRDKQLTSPGRANGFRSSHLVPAVEYLQSQRARSMMMMKLAEATADVDVYVVPTNSGGGGGRGRGGVPGAATQGAAASGATPGAAPGATTADGAAPAGGRGRGAGGGGNRSVVQRHFTLANLACYPAINTPNGFTEAGTPTNITFYARPFGEAELLAVAKAYQDASGFHLKHPDLKI
jgi:Asp-tRNA(Asn)/Glu-tRNA(Gln) amidotransferase A subunit family amidase